MTKPTMLSNPQKQKRPLLLIGLLFIVIIVALSMIQSRLSAQGRNFITGSFQAQFSEAQLAKASGFGSQAEQEMKLIASELNTLSESTPIATLDPEACSAFVSGIVARSYLSIATISRVNSEQTFDCSNTPTTPGIDGTNYPYLNTIFADPEHALVVGVPFVSTANLGERYITAIHAPLFDQQDTFVGTLGSAIFFDKLMDDILRFADLTPTTRVSLIDDNGTIIYNSKDEYLGMSIYEGPLSEQLQQDETLRDKLRTRTLGSNGVFRFTLDNELRIGAYASFTIPDGREWYITVVNPITDLNPIILPLLAEIRSEFVILSGAAFFFLLVFFLLLLWWNRRLYATIRAQAVGLQESNQHLEQNLIKLQHEERRTSEALSQSRASEGKVNQYLERSERTKRAMMNILEDVEEERNKTSQLANDLKKFELAINSTSDHVIITDPDGIILFANPAVEKITGFAVSDIIGKKVGTAELWGGMMPAEFYKTLWNTIKIKKETFEGEITNKRKNGEVYVAYSSISPILNDDGDVVFFVGIERDITKEKEVDRAKTEFVSLASHQLRTPLSAINWYAEMLLSGDAGEINDDQKQYLKEIYNGNKRMVDLVNALLNVSRIELGTFIIEPKLRSLATMVRSAVKEFSPLVKQKKISVSTKLSSAVPRLKVDVKLMRIIVDNLLSNAIKYTPEDGEIEVRLSKKKEHVLLSVKDTGYGIPKSQQDKIFTKLFRADNITRRDTVGTGLGLYICKLILDNSGGRIWFDSEEDKGTTFYVEIPLAGMKKKKGTKQLD